MTWARALALLATAAAACWLAFGFSACIQIGPSSDDGADAGPASVQDQCAEVMGAFCSRANQCYGEDPNACFEPAVETCCANACGKPATSTEHDIRSCVADIGKEDCDDVVNARLPPRCQAVVTHD